MSKKDKKKDLAKAEKKAAKKAEKAAAKKAKKEELKKLAGKPEELAEELRAQREASLAVDESSVEDAVAVVEQKQVPAPAYVPVEGDKLRTVSIKMPASLIEAADKAAAAYGAEGVSRSEFIRIAIEKLVNE
ncbi:MAG: ribbon-helix-helix protein, CopG family [Coriobacteriia bacterium]|nr:ribbon-helix-helix protein, CopG family [Coriobacteriia bacterium]